MLFNYITPVFRPPSEAESLILQVTNGCSWNRCTFCEMYMEPQKRFKPKPIAEIRDELRRFVSMNIPQRRLFLADGDAMTLSYRRLHEIMQAVNEYLPDIQRVSAYCLPRNIKNKSVEELQGLRQMGLQLLYIGCETGDDLVLDRVDKGETWQSSLEALLKLQRAGIKRSVMILNGLGGVRYSERHALNSASLMNESQPEYLATLVVSFPMGQQRIKQGYSGEFEALNLRQLLEEMEMMLSALELEKTIFRSDHASNYLVLKGVLNKDRERLLKQVRTALTNPESTSFRAEWQRGL
ncbi:MAG: radical SAM protein [gamma proteobacterium symbiont of Ctena orbiculata]|nr:radical SAM protein [Candidatus Thiodiazotropha taylori]PUB82519.1 MAG: radical SAM protein [gamma proteobacterium symbiont of Ctena orbiculata]MBT3036164.1 radical SAM protein [Candidatus Thiodiazotropha taylori]MBV2138045.1 radical SAM protein [Candidatus Thiodiazotropha taylori]PVV08784.1 MAG: radical SAM protein [gamma proteobacterium symbiont of Ctena orbiculata]